MRSLAGTLSRSRDAAALAVATSTLAVSSRPAFKLQPHNALDTFVRASMVTPKRALQSYGIHGLECQQFSHSSPLGL